MIINFYNIPQFKEK